MKYNIVACMKVTGETISLMKIEGEPKKQNAKCIQSFR